MRTRRASAAVKVSLVVGVLTLASASAAWAQPRIDAARDSGQGVTGSYEGWYEQPDGSVTLLLGYFNRNLKETLDIPVGPNNQLSPGDPDRGQPTHFLPRRQWGVFSITVPADSLDQALTWTLVAHGQTSSIPLKLDPQWKIEPLVNSAMGNTPPIAVTSCGRLALDGRGHAAVFVHVGDRRHVHASG